MQKQSSAATSEILKWFTNQGWKPFPFQQTVWESCLSGRSGLLNAPTGSGKTYALWIPLLIQHLQNRESKPGLKLLWITPLRALASDLQQAMQRICNDLDIPFRVEVRSGDTPARIKQEQLKNLPDALITTPESLHLLLAQKKYPRRFADLEYVIVDEWHELLGSKRGVQVELGLSRLRALRPKLIVWGISATIGNLDEAKDALIPETGDTVIVKGDVRKQLKISSILPDEVENFPWAGHLGIRLLAKVIPIVKESRTSLLFTNTRSQCEIWYQRILDYEPGLAGQIALHHGSLDPDIRKWVEMAIHEERLKLVVCTSSLDLGVDFHPVETVFQIGSPKGVARFLQRAGRSGHRPDAVSRIFFVPTHSLELVEGAALKYAAERQIIESRITFDKPMDVLTQYLVTLSLSEGFESESLFREISGTYAYRNLKKEEFDWALDYVVKGGKTLARYDDYSKVAADEDGIHRITNRRAALRHRTSIGTIVSDPALRVKFLKGGTIGTIEEYFLSRLKPGETFWFAGRSLELVQIKDMTAYVRRSSKKKGAVPSWMGGRMPLSAEMSDLIREHLSEASHGNLIGPEMKRIEPMLQLQAAWSRLPKKDEILIELVKDREGYHAFFYPFEGRLVHEGLAALFAWRIGQVEPITFSMAMNDYGLELLSDKEIPIEEALAKGLLSFDNLSEDIHSALNSIEMAKRKFREIARISGLIFQGYPGNKHKTKHLQASSQLLFDVFQEHEPDNLLLQQAYEEAFRFQLEEERLRESLIRMNDQKMVITRPKRSTPFCFPIMVDRLNREKLSSEKLEDRIRKLQIQLEKHI